LLSLWKTSCGKLCASPFLLHILRHIQHLIFVYVLRHTHVDESYGNMMSLDLWVLTDCQICWFRSLVSWETLDEEYVNKSSWALFWWLSTSFSYWLLWYPLELFFGGCFGRHLIRNMFSNSFQTWSSKLFIYLALNSFTKAMTCD